MEFLVWSVLENIKICAKFYTYFFLFFNIKSEKIIDNILNFYLKRINCNQYFEKLKSIFKRTKWIFMDVNKKIDVFFDNIECPICKSTINTNFKTIDIPNFGETIIFTLICQNCGYRKTDLFNVYEKKPKRYIFKFNSKTDLNIRVIKSGSCTIKIPEFGTIIEPGIESEGYITNIEGILHRINDVLTSLEKNSQEEENLAKITELKDKMKETLEGKINFTLILEDPYANSAIILEDNSKLNIENL